MIQVAKEKALQLERKFPSGDLAMFTSGETGEIVLSRSQVGWWCGGSIL